VPDEAGDGGSPLPVSARRAGDLRRVHDAFHAPPFGKLGASSCETSAMRSLHSALCAFSKLADARLSRSPTLPTHGMIFFFFLLDSIRSALPTLCPGGRSSIYGCAGCHGRGSAGHYCACGALLPNTVRPHDPMQTSYARPVLHACGSQRIGCRGSPEENSASATQMFLAPCSTGNSKSRNSVTASDRLSLTLIGHNHSRLLRAFHAKPPALHGFGKNAMRPARHALPSSHPPASAELRRFGQSPARQEHVTNTLGFANAGSRCCAAAPAMVAQFRV